MALCTLLFAFVLFKVLFFVRFFFASFLFERLWGWDTKETMGEEFSVFNWKFSWGISIFL